MFSGENFIYRNAILGPSTGEATLKIHPYCSSGCCIQGVEALDSDNHCRVCKFRSMDLWAVWEPSTFDSVSFPVINLYVA